MSYDLPDVEEWGYTDATFGATTVTHQIIGPPRKWGFARDIVVEVTTALVGTTTVPEIQLGIASGDFTYGRYRLGKTAIAGYPVGIHRASDELINGNPPRVATDFPGHVVLDGGPLGSSPQNVIGGTEVNQQPLGRIPYAGRRVQNVTAGTSNSGNSARIFLDDATGIPLGSLVLIQGIAGITATLTGTGASGDLTMGVGLVNATAGLSSPPFGPGSYIELNTTGVPSGTYTAGGMVSPIVIVTALAGTGGVPAGGANYRIRIAWMGQTTP